MLSISPFLVIGDNTQIEIANKEFKAQTNNWNESHMYSHVNTESYTKAKWHVWYIKNHEKSKSRHKPPWTPYLYSPYLSPPLATKHQKGRLELRTSPGLEESKPSTSWALSRSGRRRCDQMVEMEGMWRHYESCIEVKQNREYGVSLWCFYKR